MENENQDKGDPRAIWKFLIPDPLPHNRQEFTLIMPASDDDEFSFPDILRVGTDPASGFGALWAVVKPGMQTTKEFKFLVVGTGAVFDWDPWYYQGTFATVKGYVWHVFSDMELG